MPHDASQKSRFAGEVGACGVEFVADNHVVASGDEEGNLGGSGGSSDLNRADSLSCFRENHRLRIVVTEEETCRDFLSKHNAGDGGGERKLLIREVSHVVRVVEIGSALNGIGVLNRLLCNREHLRVEDRDDGASAEGSGRSQDVTDDSEGLQRNNLDAASIDGRPDIAEYGSAHLSGATQGFINGVESVDASDEKVFLPRN